ncbi:MAG: (Fe-S)-binding protein [Candidatus Atribacteria bacterium]|nr:(Fe-S)-binding protein [Candidatus Atribacteria bacterium]
MGINHVREVIKNCRFCFMCRHACPTFLATKLDSHTPRGYALMLSEIAEGIRDWTDDFVKKFYQCSQCGLCREDCEFHWPEDELVRHAREDIVEKNREPQNVKNVLQSVQVTGTPFGHGLGYTLNSRSNNQYHPDVVYFSGCSTRYNHPEIINATENLLNRCGVNWVRMEDEECCGMPLYDLGYTQEARQQAKKTYDKLVAIHPKTILTGCPHCLRNFREIYPQWQFTFPKDIQILHITEFLQEKIQDQSLMFHHKVSLKSVSYHDPCQLGRKLKVYDAPRFIIQEMTGQAPTELFHSREKAECCGAGSIQFFIDPEISQKVANVRMNRVLEEKSPVLITACQNCKTVFQSLIEKEFPSLQVMDIVELANLEWEGGE